jgi:hypothetical protein
LAAIAPFLHILPSKESTEKIFGFTNMRTFLYAIGFPFSLFTVSVFVAFLANLIELRPYKKALKIGSITFISVSVYFIIWTFWYKKDFNVYAYYSAMGLASITTSYFIYRLLKSISKKLKTLNAISNKIHKLAPDIEYVNGIADLMPDSEDTVTYKAMLDTTGDDLRKTYKTIEEELDEGLN